MDTPALVVEREPDAREVAFLEDQINQLCIDRTGIDDWQPLAIFVRDERGELRAGVSGATWAGYLDLKLLWVREDLRGQGLGSRLLAAAEDEARARGCSQVLLDTHDFQAATFYPRYGYVVLGQLEGIGGHHTRYYMRKQL